VRDLRADAPWRRWLPATLAALFAAAAAGLAWAEGLGGAHLLHGACMILAWGGMLPAGAIVARWWKVTPGQDFPRLRDNPLWWNWHRALQYGGIAVATAGLVAILLETGGRFAHAHAWIGAAAMLLGWAQVIGAQFRGSKGGPTDPAADPADPATWRGDHFDMTPRRRVFEALHKTGGWLTLALAALALGTGVALIGTPDWLLALLGLAWMAALFAALDLARQRRHVDTYVAIWGPALHSPLLPPKGKTQR
jgi:hypothetical protein